MHSTMPDIRMPSSRDKSSPKGLGGCNDDPVMKLEHREIAHTNQYPQVERDNPKVLTILKPSEDFRESQRCSPLFGDMHQLRQDYSRNHSNIDAFVDQVKRTPGHW